MTSNLENITTSMLEEGNFQIGFQTHENQSGNHEGWRFEGPLTL